MFLQPAMQTGWVVEWDAVGELDSFRIADPDQGAAFWDLERGLA